MTTTPRTANPPPDAPIPEMPAMLQEALRTHPDREALAQLWGLLGHAASVSGEAAPDAAWAQIATATAATSATAPATRKRGAPRDVVPFRPRALDRGRRWSPRVLAMAATLAVAVGATLWQTLPVRERALAGAHRTIVLPDGSRVELNAGSELRYARGFRTPWFARAPERTLTLDGEAFFDVQAGPRPFVVRTQTARVTVLGTSFLVRAHTSDNMGTDVAVKSGRVQVEPARRGEQTLMLRAGEGATVAAGRVMRVSLDMDGVNRRTMWRRGGIALVDQPLDAVFRELERQYATEIQLVNVVVGTERLTLYYPERPSLETVLDDLCTRGGLRYRRTSRGYDIMPAAEPIAPTR